jgi:glycosyltransferase 2 family protein
MTVRVLRSWRFGVGVAVLLFVLAGVDPAAVRASLVDANLGLVIAGVIGLTAVHLVPAAGWRAIHGRTTGRWLSWRGTVELSYAAQAIGGVTPANVGGDVHRATALRRSGQDIEAAVAPLLVQRATSYLALSALAIAACAILATRAPMAGGLSIAGVVVAIAVAGAAWLLVAPPGPLRGRRDRLLGGTPAPLRGVGGAAAIGLGSGLAFHAAAIGLTGLLVLAVDPRVPLVPVLAALAVARLAIAVPITPSGLGVQEGVLAVLFTALGLAAGVGLAAMLLARLALVLTTVIGVALLVRSRHAAELDPSPAPDVARGGVRRSKRHTAKDAPLVRS